MHINLSTIQNFAAALIAWTGLSGLVIPYFVAFVTKSHWSAKIKQPVMIASSIALAVLTYLGTQGWNVHSWTDLFAAITACVIGAQAAYHKLWGKSDLVAAASRLTDGKPKTSKKNVVKPAELPDGVISTPEGTFKEGQ